MRSLCTAVLLLLLSLLLMPACARIYPQSGADKSQAVNVGYYEDEMYGMDDGWAGEVAEAPAARGMLSENAMAPEPQEPAGDGLTGPPSMVKQFNLDDWFLPKAYAADTGLDERYLIRNGDISLKIDDYDAATAEITAVAEKHDGVVTDSQMSKHGDGTRSGWITLRVPGESFFAAWEELKQTGEVNNQQVSSEDVSSTYVSAISRLKILQKEQETLEAMLAEAREVQRTRGLGEAYSVLLQTQERLSEVNYQIQQTEDQVSQLADKITRSTIIVNLTERVEYESEGFTWGYGEAFEGAKKDLMLKWRAFVQGVIYFFVSGWTALVPWLVVLVIIWLLWRKWVAPLLGKRKARRTIGEVASGDSKPAGDSANGNGEGKK